MMIRLLISWGLIILGNGVLEGLSPSTSFSEIYRKGGEKLFEKSQDEYLKSEEERGAAIFFRDLSQEEEEKLSWEPQDEFEELEEEKELERLLQDTLSRDDSMEEETDFYDGASTEEKDVHEDFYDGESESLNLLKERSPGRSHFFYRLVQYAALSEREASLVINKAHAFFMNRKLVMKSFLQEKKGRIKKLALRGDDQQKCYFIEEDDMLVISFAPMVAAIGPLYKEHPDQKALYDVQPRQVGGYKDIVGWNGFLKEAEDLYPYIRDWLKTFYRNDPRPIVFVGHSRGGGMGVLMSLFMKEDKDLKDKDLSVYLFSSPCMLNRRATEVLKEKGVDSTHVFLAGDKNLSVPIRGRMLSRIKEEGFSKLAKREFLQGLADEREELFAMGETQICVDKNDDPLNGAGGVQIGSLDDGWANPHSYRRLLWNEEAYRRELTGNFLKSLREDRHMLWKIWGVTVGDRKNRWIMEDFFETLYEKRYRRNDVYRSGPLSDPRPLYQNYKLSKNVQMAC